MAGFAPASPDSGRRGAGARVVAAAVPPARRGDGDGRGRTSGARARRAARAARRPRGDVPRGHGDRRGNGGRPTSWDRDEWDVAARRRHVCRLFARSPEGSLVRGRRVRLIRRTRSALTTSAVDVRLPGGARLPAMRSHSVAPCRLSLPPSCSCPYAGGRHRSRTRPRHLLHRRRGRRRDAHRHAGGRIDPDRLGQPRRARRGPDCRRREGRRHHRDRPLHHHALAQRSRRRRRAAVEAAADQGPLRPRDPEPAPRGHQRAAHRRLEGPRRRAAISRGRRHLQVHQPSAARPKSG